SPGRVLIIRFGGCPLRSESDPIAARQQNDAMGQSGHQEAPKTRNRSIYTPVSAILRRGGVRLDLRPRPPLGSGPSKPSAASSDGYVHTLEDLGRRAQLPARRKATATEITLNAPRTDHRTTNIVSPSAWRT